MLELRGVSKVYKTGNIKRTVLKKVTLNFRTSEFVAILGPSGSGKTTLLNIIGGLDQYDSGDLTINEKTTKKFRDKDWDAYRNHRIGFVFQSYNLIPHQTVLQNVRLALTLSGISKRESIRRAKKALSDVGLSEHIYKRPAQLSGGQMQRVAIARALVNNPDILLADEPTGALDSETSVQIMELLKRIAKDKLVVMVTHNPELAHEYATRIIKLKDGKIISDTKSYNGKKRTDLDLADSKQKSKKTKMSFLTAAGLSFNNLLTKKARTILVAAAGSIGIIGIALISAVSTGFQNYIDSIERDTLTSYPLSLMRESTDLTGVLLSISDDDKGNSDNKIIENQVITSVLGNVSTNDLKSFREYLDRNSDEVKDDIRLIEEQYSVAPLVYTEDATGNVAKLNPSNLFASVLGDGTFTNMYSSATSVYEQYERENMELNTDLVAGRYPESYDEVVISLQNPHQIPDLLTYSLGFHNTNELSDAVTKIMTGENVKLDNKPLELTNDDLLSLDLRLVKATDTYKFNPKYDVYEDMSEDESYMRDIYNTKSEKLKVVGIVTPHDGVLAVNNGVLYLPSLTEHIIEEASKTEIVKKQLSSPEIDIFSNKKFGEKDTSNKFEFSDLVSVDNSALSKAFNVTIDQNAISAKTMEYMNEISGDITADITPVKDKLVSRFNELSTQLASELNETTIKTSEVDKTVEDFIAKQDFSALETEYKIPATTFSTSYAGLLKGLLTAYITAYNATMEQMGLPVDADDPSAQVDADALNEATKSYLKVAAVDEAFETLSITITEIIMKSQILTAVGNLTAYLSTSFSSAFNIDQNALLGAFKLNFSEEELARVVTAMFTKKEATLTSNLTGLGYQDLENPSFISFYFTSFEGKTHFIEFLDNYNELMKSYDTEDKVIQYTDTTGILMSSVKTIVDAVSYVLIAFVSISLIVSSIMIGVITYISVYERTKEIGILRAIGASKHNISSIFNAETFIIGLLSGLIGVAFSYLSIPLINLVLHHFIGDIPLYVTLHPRTAGLLIMLSIILTLIGGLIPAKSASKKDPVEALRTE